ncbi:TRAP transporter substrate-binding protein [Bradyrhizobium sp. CCBAU 45384]|uniref:TRAP transporter substrate-binding protein n=1 Tax=Bradyrhizobium sp. CCBAU 45384 TaxID=858428 RepID=UPI00230648B0|nr:TRAP transporter substrate-binding protein DctP [Bradyrhizobium sp. CCBAU 45384]MDA9410598.1 C4-dicarboxylate ABC transporter substrate-binding protein [Bradyrhizobium sp. CCBAU 45384]
MLKLLARCAVISFVLTSALAAEPVKLKLAFFSSDRSTSYLAAVKPFVDAVNAEARGQIEIETYFSGALGKDPAEQPQLVLDGRADIAYVVTGLTRNRFADNAILELPGLFASMRESVAVLTRLMAANALQGYDDYIVIGAYVSEPETFHSNIPITSLNDLKNKRIRVNNPGEAAALEKLGARPVLLPVNKISEAIGNGSIDGALVNPASVVDYGVKRVATYHYLLGISGAPLMVLMNRKTFNRLPKTAQSIILKYSGAWSAGRFVDTYEAVESSIMGELKSDPNRHVIMPSPSDLDAANAVFATIADDWASKSQRNAELLKTVKAELTKMRSTR